MYDLRKVTLQEVMDNIENQKFEIPALQRPFVWKQEKVLNLVKSAYNGIPLGTLCTWEQEGILLADGTRSNDASWLVIDGQQRLAAIRTALLGMPIQNGTGVPKRIEVAFNPVEGEFALRTKSMNSAWIRDIAPLFTKEWRATEHRYLSQKWLDDENGTREKVEDNLDKLRRILTCSMGLFEIHKEMELEHVFEVFRHVNQSPTRVENIQICFAELQTEFPELAELVVRFCLELENPCQAKKRRDIGQKLPLYNQLDWMQRHNFSSYAYKPDKFDLMKVIIWRAFKNGSWENTIGTFRTKENAEQRLKDAILDIVSEEHFTEFNALMHKMQMFTGLNQGNIAYWLYLRCMLDYDEPMSTEVIRSSIYRWLLTTNLQGVQRGGPDIQGPVNGFLKVDDPHAYIDEAGAFTTESFFQKDLPDLLTRQTASTGTRVWQVWQAVQAIAEDTALFHTDAVIDSPENTEHRHLHHVYCKDLLSKANVPNKEQNAVANRVITTESVNRDIGTTAFHKYTDTHYGHDPETAVRHMEAHCLPAGTGTLPYTEFLQERAKAMAEKIARVYRSLKP